MDTRLTPAQRIRQYIVKEVAVNVNYAEAAGITAAVSQHLYNMKWQHLMDHPDTVAVGFLQKRWKSLYWKSQDAMHELSMKGHKASDLDELYGDD